MALTRKDIFIAALFSVVLFGSIGGVIVYNLFQNTGPFWPTISNPSELLQECKPMLNIEQGFIKDVNWPESIKELEPMLVYSNRDSVDITIATGGISPISWGYLIYPDGRKKTNASSDFIIKDSIHPGIFKYERKKE